MIRESGIKLHWLSMSPGGDSDYARNSVRRHNGTSRNSVPHVISIITNKEDGAMPHTPCPTSPLTRRFPSYTGCSSILCLRVKHQGSLANEPGNVTEVYFQVYFRFYCHLFQPNDLNFNRKHLKKIFPQSGLPAHFLAFAVAASAPECGRISAGKGGVFMDADYLEEGDIPLLYNEEYCASPPDRKSPSPQPGLGPSVSIRINAWRRMRHEFR